MVEISKKTVNAVVLRKDYHWVDMYNVMGDGAIVKE